MLFSQINSILNDQKSVTFNATSDGIPAASLPSTNAKIWTKDEVISWLTTNELQNLTKVFKDYTGKTLKALYEMKRRDYSLFCSTIKEEIEEAKVKIQTFERLNFYESLDELFN